MADRKRTPLFSEYKKLGAKTVNFGGWEMPVQFTGIKQEHHATRNAAGLFDISHMGEILVEGNASQRFLQKMLTNDVSLLTPKKAQYTIMCYEDGGTVDDLIVYMLNQNKYLLVVNAANLQKDYEWLEKHKESDVELTNCSDYYVQLAIQGPKAEMILQKLTQTNLSSIKFFHFETPVQFEGINEGAIVSRTGYTGEDGFEIYLDASAGSKLWNQLLEAGESEGLQPIGLGARDTLRFEANLALYGQELTKEITPIEAGLGFAVKANKKDDFIGKSVLKKQKEEGPKRKLVGVEMIEKGIPRHGYEVIHDGHVVGVITSGTQSPTLNKNVGLALIDTDLTKIGTELFIQIRNKQRKACVVKTPFYKRS
ncbi:glycine cleavage system aminomethyltransferase GcvT [Aquibacillus albus]|uniref:Aminomethyltransferase n=1 Tax=Aquibacillus albus TaxID=1168171 RepID=A0ABS2MVG3_9BACI|nr:glycine cleavage system aminomethyltransferase GcvT [Aquibacillus albus]MBM7569685.1 aminomethyltransferase [Aquibacillus albus]